MQDAPNNSDLIILKDELLSKHTTFKIGGPATMLAEPRDIRQLARLIFMARKNNVRYMVIGNGSDVLFSDKGFGGLVIKTYPNFGAIILEENGILRAEAGARLSQVACVAADNSLSGLEFAHGIPGTIGGAIFMNAGAYGGEMAGLVLRSCIIDSNGDLRMISQQEHEFGYRQSVFKENTDYTLLYTELQLASGSSAEIRAKMADFSARRRQSQPLDMPSAGSAFKRPQNGYAAQMIEECGLKGFKIGGAQVSEKHAGFIVNTGNATCEDVCAVMNHVEQEVFRAKGIKLEREIQVVE